MQGLGAWILQRISAVILIVLVAIHFGIMHFVDPTAKITFASSSLRLKGVLYFLFDSGLLFVGLYHGLNGIRAIIFDYWPKAGRVATWVLTLVGLLFAGYGSAALYLFLTLN